MLTFISKSLFSQLFLTKPQSQQEKSKLAFHRFKNYVLKACVLYFLSNFYFSPNDSPSKTMKNAFYFIQKALFVLEIFKFLYFRLPPFFSLSAIALEVDRR